jgi:small conductance mechanosensitive channel
MAGPGPATHVLHCRSEPSLPPPVTVHMLDDANTQHLVYDVHLLLPLIVTNALHALAAIVILIIGFWFAGRAQVLLVRSLSRTHYLDAMLKGFFGNIVRYFILTITFLAVLSQFGIQTTSLIAVLGAAGLAVGLALQGTLSHVAAGVMLLIFRPFRIGHHVQVGGIDGTVRELSLLWTEVVTSDNMQVIVPNGSVWGQPLRNFSVYPQPVGTTQVRFRAPGVDPRTAQARMAEIVAAMPSVRQDPAPTVLLDRNETDTTLEIVVSFAPTESGAAASVKSEIIDKVYDALEAPPAEETKPA